MELWQILTLVMGAITLFFGVYWSKAKLALAQVKSLLTAIVGAIEDDQLTREELIIIAEEIKKLIAIFKSSEIQATTDKIELKKKQLKAAKR